MSTSKKYLAITVGGLELDLSYSKQGIGTKILGVIQAEKGEPIKFNRDLLKKMRSPIYLQEGLEIDLKNVIFASIQNAKLAAVNFGTEINLSNLPLVGKTFPKDQTLSIDNFQVLLSKTKADIAPEEMGLLNQIIPSDISWLPNHLNANENIRLLAKLRMGNDLESIDTGPRSPAAQTVTSQNTSTQSAGQRRGTWLNIQKKFGPVHFNRIGIRYDIRKNTLWFLLDASFSKAGLSISLDGLGMGSTLKEFKPKFTLAGLGVDYKKGQLEIGGAFLRKEISGQPVEYDGEVLFKLQPLSISALGSYTTVQNEPSLFIYALVNEPLGGPAFFFVTGLALGFGYNRGLLIPPVEQLTSFPLIAEAIRGDGLPSINPQKALQKELETLHSYIPPRTGENFIAVGVKFTTFDIVDSFVLLTVAFGHELSFNVLGMSTLLLPPTAPGEKTVMKDPLAEIQVALRASYVPAAGELKVDARLTPASYILSKACRLSGGFAFYSWFKDQAGGVKAGDFVVTLGGYHPKFNVPDHYPVVPRLAFNWPIDSHTHIKGSMYFALCPHAAMAGGELAATYESGPLKAWFTIGADFLIMWKPYHYDIDVHVSIGGSFTYHFFGTHHISVHLGADLHIWGPDFGGHAKIHLWIVSIGIDFGDQSSAALQPIDWEEFRNSFLPSNEDITSVQVAGGLVSGSTGKGNDLGVINPQHLVLTTDSVIPSSAGEYFDKNALAGHPQPNKPAIGVMAVKESELQSSHKIKIRKGSVDVISDFKLTPIYKTMPAALWGDKLKVMPNDPRLVDNALSGFIIEPAKPPKADQTLPIKKSDMAFEMTKVARASYWQSGGEQDKAQALGKTQLEGMTEQWDAQMLAALGFDVAQLDVGDDPANNFRGLRVA